MTYNLPSLYYTYNIRDTGIIDSLEQSHSSSNDLIFIKATNAATKPHKVHYKKHAFKYKHLSLITLNNKQLWPRHCESIEWLRGLDIISCFPYTSKIYELPGGKMYGNNGTFYSSIKIYE